MLHFGRNQLTWECKGSGALNEVFPDGKHASISYLQREGPGMLNLEPLTALSLTDRRDTAGTLWKLSVECYCKGALTIASDKMPAIHGIAEQISALARAGYEDGFFPFHFRNRCAGAILVGRSFQFWSL
jgi:hypothetical protein